MKKAAIYCRLSEEDKNKLCATDDSGSIQNQKAMLVQYAEEQGWEVYQIYSDVEVNTFLPWFPVKSIEEAFRLYEEQYAAQYVQPRAYAYAICLKSDGIPIGYIHVSPGESHDLGYGFRREFWHCGIAAEAARAVIHQVKEDGFPYVTATHDVNNPRSGHVMQAVGMRYQYSYEEMWQPKNFLVTFRMYQLNLDGNDGRVYRKYWDSYDNHFVETL